MLNSNDLLSKFATACSRFWDVNGVHPEAFDDILKEWDLYTSWADEEPFKMHPVVKCHICNLKRSLYMGTTWLEDDVMRLLLDISYLYDNELTTI
jgi:hypothetical protein